MSRYLHPLIPFNQRSPGAIELPDHSEYIFSHPSLSSASFWRFNLCPLPLTLNTKTGQYRIIEEHDFPTKTSDIDEEDEVILNPDEIERPFEAETSALEA